MDRSRPKSRRRKEDCAGLARALVERRVLAFYGHGGCTGDSIYLHYSAVAPNTNKVVERMEDGSITFKLREHMLAGTTLLNALCAAYGLPPTFRLHQSRLFHGEQELEWNTRYTLVGPVGSLLAGLENQAPASAPLPLPQMPTAPNDRADTIPTVVQET